MPRPGAGARGQRGDVDALGLEPRGRLGLDELGLPRGDGLVDAAAGLTDELAERGLVLGGDVAQPCVQLRRAARPRPRAPSAPP